MDNQTITSTLNGKKQIKGISNVTYKDGVKNYYANVNGSIETFNKEE